MRVKSKIRKTTDMHHEDQIKALQFANVILQIIEQSDIDLRISFNSIINLIPTLARSLELTAEELNGVFKSVNEVFNHNLDN